jgi:hypothetical protein
MAVAMAMAVTTVVARAVATRRQAQKNRVPHLLEPGMAPGAFTTR